MPWQTPASKAGYTNGMSLFAYLIEQPFEAGLYLIIVTSARWLPAELASRRRTWR